MYREMLVQFDERSLPDLDIAVLGALELFTETALPAISLGQFQKPLVLGSGNAAVVGRLLFEDFDARFGDESTYEHELAEHKERITSAVIVSALGGKDAVRIAQILEQEKIPAWLLTNNEHASVAGQYIDASRIVIFPNNREPYTYNVSTYLGMLLARTKEDPEQIETFIEETVTKSIPDTLGTFDAFYLILPLPLVLMREMFLTKFDELFGARVSARVFTIEQSKHARTIVPSETECFVSFGEENTIFGDEKNRLHIPLPENAGYAALMAIGYYVIGQIQKQHPPYFKDNIKAYTKQASAFFNQTITPIAE